MSLEIKVPVLGEGIDSGDVLEIFVNEGDVIEQEQGLVELETDKATVTVPATVGGTVTKIHVSEGDSIDIGAVIVTVEEGGSSAPADTSAVETTPAPQPPADSSPSVEPPETSKPVETVESVESVESLKPVEPRKPVEPVAPVAAVTPELPNAEMPTPTDQSDVAAGPAIRRLAREVGIDLRQVAATGEHGRVTREDVMQAVRGGASRSSANGDQASGESDGFGPVRTEKMPKIRQTIARKMHESWTAVPRVTNFDDADVTDLEAIRKNSKTDYAARDIKLTTMPFIIKAVAMALKSHPVINASVDLDAGKIVYKEYVNIGIAVDTDRGLVVPALRNADQLPIPDIARQLSDMADNVRDNNFSIDDLRGGTFTISNLGAIGGTYSTPIVNTPETAILLIGRSRQMPVVVGDEIRSRLMMPLSLSYDHRLIDGGAAARFLNEVIGYLETPGRLLLAL
ncbi:MAG: 2-oxo acid dehydrogenase subunit E2 [Mariniblastus sp.]|nr:2-oxo acid dehydrogenase subunit E2 [Mariniblastus sp.]